MKTVQVLPERMKVIDTDQGVELVEQVQQLEQLIDAYRRGILKQRFETVKK